MTTINLTKLSLEEIHDMLDACQRRLESTQRQAVAMLREGEAIQRELACLAEELQQRRSVRSH